MPTPNKSFAKAFFEDIKETAPVDNTRTEKPKAVATHYESEAEKQRKADNESEAEYYDKVAAAHEENAKRPDTYFDKFKGNERNDEIDAVRGAHEAAVSAEWNRTGNYDTMNKDSVDVKGQRFYNENRRAHNQPEVGMDEYKQRKKDADNLEGTGAKDWEAEAGKNFRRLANESRDKNNRVVRAVNKVHEDEAKAEKNAQTFEHNLHKYDRNRAFKRELVQGNPAPKMLQRPKQKSFAKKFFEDID